MPTEVHCPDCGKIIAPAGTIDDAVRCRCGEAGRHRLTPKDVSFRPSISVPIPEAAPAAKPQQGTVDDDIETFGESSASTATEKTCYVCGASLARRVRLKDHLGRYWCKQCAAADKRSKRHEEKGRCHDCSRVFDPRKLTTLPDNVRVCPSCFKAREKALEKKIVRHGIEKTHQRHETRKLMWLAVIAAVLLLLGLIHHFLR